MEYPKPNLPRNCSWEGHGKRRDAARGLVAETGARRLEEAMSSDEKRDRILHEIAAWREAWAASEPGSPQQRDFQNKMKAAEWKLQALGPSRFAGPRHQGCEHRQGRRIGGIRWATSQQVQYGVLAD